MEGERMGIFHERNYQHRSGDTWCYWRKTSIIYSKLQICGTFAFRGNHIVMCSAWRQASHIKAADLHLNVTGQDQIQNNIPWLTVGTTTSPLIGLSDPPRLGPDASICLICTYLISVFVWGQFGVAAYHQCLSVSLFDSIESRNWSRVPSSPPQKENTDTEEHLWPRQTSQHCLCCSL